MRTSVPWGHTVHVRHVAWRHGHDRAPVVARDLAWSVRWAWGLMAVTLPAGLLAVLLVDAVAAVSDLSATGLWAGLVVYAAVVAPLVASIVIGLRAWQDTGEKLALRAALVSTGLIALGTVLVLGAALA